MINTTRVWPCQSPEQIIKSKDFKRVLNIIFSEIENNIIIVSNIESFNKIKIWFEKLFKNQVLNDQDIESINLFLDESMKSNSDIQKAINKVLKKVEVHSFLDSCNSIQSIKWYVDGKHKYTKGIIENQEIGSIVWVIHDKVKKLTEEQKIEEDWEEIKEEVNFIINKVFIKWNYEEIILLANKIRNWITKEDKENRKTNRSIFEWIVNRVIWNEENTKKDISKIEIVYEKIGWQSDEEAQKIKENKEKEIRKIVWLILSYLANKSIDIDHKITAISNIK